MILQEGFRYHHAEPDYLMLVCWLPETADTIPLNASHRVGVGSFVMNSKREVWVLDFMFEPWYLIFNIKFVLVWLVLIDSLSYMIDKFEWFYGLKSIFVWVDWCW